MNDLTFRTELRPGDVGWLIHRHGVVYAAEWGFDPTFEAYVAEPLAKFVKCRTERERLWIAELDGKPVGWIAVVTAETDTAQLRWFLVEPEARGKGVGKKLFTEAVMFCRQVGYTTAMLWTVDRLTTAAKLYRDFGFSMVEEKPDGHGWAGSVEQKYELRLA